MTRRMRQLLDRIQREIPGGLVVAEDMLQAFADEGGKAADFYERFHWGNEPTTLDKATAPVVRAGEVLTALGPLVEVVYEADKGRELAHWVHPFEDPLPVLAYTQTGRLVIVGGGYHVNARGIVG